MNTTVDWQQKIKLYQEYKDAYYTGEPLVSDEEFDALEYELIQAGHASSIGYQSMLESRKINHLFPMLSLGKQQILEDSMHIDIAAKIFNEYGPGLLSWKYDGLAIEVAYDRGMLQSISTRGNGKMGINVTEKFRFMFPESIIDDRPLSLRCEMILPKQVFQIKYAEQYRHSRNLIAGIVNDINIDDSRKYDATYLSIEIISDGYRVPLHQWDKRFAERFKRSKQIDSATDLKNAFDSMHQSRDAYEYDVDGAVYHSAQEHHPMFSFKGNHPDYAIAIKFKPPRLISTITGITWRLHKTGRYVPNIHFQPIIVDGRTITKASGHNLEYLVKHQLSTGQQVQIILSNDIIPMVKPIKNQIDE